MTNERGENLADRLKRLHEEEVEERKAREKSRREEGRRVVGLTSAAFLAVSVATVTQSLSVTTMTWALEGALCCFALVIPASAICVWYSQNYDCVAFDDGDGVVFWKLFVACVSIGTLGLVCVFFHLSTIVGIVSLVGIALGFIVDHAGGKGFKKRSNKSVDPTQHHDDSVKPVVSTNSVPKRTFSSGSGERPPTSTGFVDSPTTADG